MHLFLIRFLLCVIVGFYTTSLLGAIRLPSVVGDSMVLQRDAKVRIWGWANQNQKIVVSFKGKRYSATTGHDGKWMIVLQPMKAGGPFTMTLSGDGSNIILNDILIGDVWLCAGQSNMVHYFDLHKDRYKKQIAEANIPFIRQFLIPTRPDLTTRTTDIPNASWKSSTPKNVLRFSVVAYFFAKQLYDKYHVPIGIVNASVGGTPVEAWTSEEGLAEFPDLINMIKVNKDSAYVNGINRKAAQARLTFEKNRTGDKGLKDHPNWYSEGYVPLGWAPINVPGYWEDQGIKGLDGVLWYRKEINIPTTMNDLPARLALGRIVDADEVYWNGKEVGKTTYQYPQRRYDLPRGILKAGKNVLIVRVTNNSAKGGFIPDKPYYVAAGNDTVDLKGTWHYKVGEVFAPQPAVPMISHQNQPASLFNGMLSPVVNYNLRGAIWYQGESNADRPDSYEKLLHALIRDWRKQFQKSDLPFLYAQLPNFMDANYLPSESKWATIREGQRKALSLPYTGMAVTIDLGEWNDIHPGNKKPIGERLALSAMKVAYEETTIVASGPIIQSAARDGNKLTLTFDHTGAGLISKDNSDLRWFEVAGPDHKFYNASSKIDRNKIIVYSDKVASPLYCRYAWSDNPHLVNFFNKEGLPASPFEVATQEASKLWHGKKATVVLTYDDALEVQLDNAIPALDSLGLKGSFYLSAASPGSKNHIEGWRLAAANGHELGNHTLYHPCDATKPGRSWVSPQNDLSRYTTVQIARETEMTNTFLESIDGKKERTFAYTCGDTGTGEGSFIEAIKGQFVSMRGTKGELNTMATLDLKNLNCYVIDNNNADQLITWAEKAKNENALMIVLFHGVGGGHNINVDLKKHNQFLQYLKSNENDFWVTTLLDASQHCIQQQKTK